MRPHPSPFTAHLAARRWPLRACAVALAAVLAACGREPAPAVQPVAVAGLAEGERFAARIAAAQVRTPRTMGDDEIVAAGYLERHRRGFGSPFRLMEQALRDRRLTPRTQGPLVWALLRETAEGRGYVIDPRALAGMGVDSLTRAPGARALHLAVIHDAVRAGRDPREGELAVRQAYRLAATEYEVSQRAPLLAAWTAALLRDRELARGDARRLLAEAASTGRHPFPLLAEWRRAGRFSVEAPPMDNGGTGVEDGAALRAGRILDQVRAVRAWTLRGASAPLPAGPTPLSAGAGRRLSTLARLRNEPPQAALFITVRRYEDALEEADAKRLARTARTEERFAAELARAPEADVVSVAAMETAVALRPFAQEPVWVPGDPFPSRASLRQRFGLRSVDFDDEIPPAWRPYYQHVLAGALDDLELVLPGLDLRGAAFRIGDTGRSARALALHDPGPRRVLLPPETGGGSIAHEIAHDLDWQVARVRYDREGAYGSELAVKEGRDDRFAMAARRMPAPPTVPVLGGDADAEIRYAQRRPEIFARSFDGYVAAALAARGRSNGHLSALQDEWLTGYGLALSPGEREEAAVPFMEMLGVASPVPEAERRAFLLRWGPERVPSAAHLAADVLRGAPSGRAPGAAVRPAPGMQEVLSRGDAVRRHAAQAAAARDSALARWEAAWCANPLLSRGPRADLAVRRAVRAAEEARVRGVVLRHARALGYQAPPAWLRHVWLGAEAPDSTAPGWLTGWRSAAQPAPGVGCESTMGVDDA